MRVFRDISIKNKLRTIILLTSGIVLLLASSAFVTNEWLSFRRTMVADLFTLAELVGLNSSAMLIFNAQQEAAENLMALKAKPSIVLAHLFSQNGKVFASYFREKNSVKKPKFSNLSAFYFSNPEMQNQTDKLIQDNYFFHHDHVEIFKKIVFDDEIIGMVYIQSDLKELNARLVWGGYIVIVILLVSFLIAFILASKLQQVITTPIYSLLQTMKQISQERNYSVRVTKSGDDELGHLIVGFNDMLSQIETRDKELSEYRDHLEDMVNQRTGELAEARDQALAANKAKSIFLANMSHEIRTPMNAVLGYAQILRRDEKLTQEQRESLQIIENSGNHLLELINDILDLSKIEAGAMELRPENFYLNSLIENISAMFKIRCQQKQLDWHVEMALNDKVLIYADQGKLRQVMINLLGNAVKFTDQGGIVLRVSVLELDQYRFDVIDTGQGIPLEVQEAIFEPFQQEKAGFDKGGTGLGLAITKRQVELMGGSLKLSSEPNQGSCFTVYLPLPPGQGEVVSHSKPIQISRLAPECHVVALVVDDVEENRDILSRILRDVGVEVYEAVNGQDAIEKIHQKFPDIVFMDIRMPVMDGTKAVQCIYQEFGQKIICVAISASTLEHQSQEVLEAGFNDFISKPFRFENIYDCLVKFLKVNFEYKVSETQKVEEKPAFQLDTNELSLPQDLYQRLIDAAELNELTEMETIVKQMREGPIEQQTLAETIQKFLVHYDFDAILAVLEKVKIDN